MTGQGVCKGSRPYRYGREIDLLDAPEILDNFGYFWKHLMLKLDLTKMH